MNKVEQLEKKLKMHKLFSQGMVISIFGFILFLILRNFNIGVAGFVSGLLLGFAISHYILRRIPEK